MPIVPALGKLRQENCCEFEVILGSKKNKTNQNGRCLSFQECAARGEDYEKVKLLEISAEDAERWERRKKRKNPDLGFSGTADLCWPLLY